MAELALKDHQQQAREEDRKQKQLSEHRLGVAKQAALEARGRAEQAEAALAEQKQALKLQLEEANQKLKVSKGRADAVQTALVELQAQAQEVEELLTARAQEARTACKEAQGRAEQAEVALQNLKHEVQAARAAASQAGTASSQEAAVDGDKRHLEQMTLLLRQLLKGRSGAGKQASHLPSSSCPGVLVQANGKVAVFTMCCAQSPWHGSAGVYAVLGALSGNKLIKLSLKPKTLNRKYSMAATSMLSPVHAFVCLVMPQLLLTLKKKLDPSWL